MPTTNTVIVGAGQAGLTLSRYLTRAGHDHAVLDGGRIGERWRTERWESLALLTPNWLNRLHGGRAHGDADGYLQRDAFVDYLRSYARTNRAPVHEYAAVTRVAPSRAGFHVDTEAGRWHARNVVVATGDSAVPHLPAASASTPRFLHQLPASRYRNPAALPDGGVLIVGAGPSGQQIAAELRRAGRIVILAVGRHARMMRRYRGRDIFTWLKDLGDLDRTLDEVYDPIAAKLTPSFALTGANAGEHLDLAVLHRLGVTVTGRFERFEGRRAVFAADLQDSLADAERRMRRVLDKIDDHIEQFRPRVWLRDSERLAAVDLPAGRETIDLASAGIATVIWATGYRREYPWLHVPVLDGEGEIVHLRGVTPINGVYVLGLKFQHRRSSHFIGGVGADAGFIAAHVLGRCFVRTGERTPGTFRTPQGGNSAHGNHRVHHPRTTRGCDCQGAPAR
jgi:putative flavoprotein involved in K+ transport